MYENVLFQKSTVLLSDAIKKNILSNSILFSGPSGSGKLTASLETARILSCKENPQGKWECKCESCLRHKSMVSPNVLIVGSSNKTLEIAAAGKTLLQESINNSSHLEAARYLFIRAVRKLTIRFSTVLWQDDDKLSKFLPVVQQIDMLLEPLDPVYPLPDHSEIEAAVLEIEELCSKLEGTFLYDSIPVSQIRNISSWAHLSANNGKKIVIIENADKMADSSRNALLKILEEPPEDVIFILTTSNRSSMLPTILSRVRTYSFVERTLDKQLNLIDRVFHCVPADSKNNPQYSINDFLLSFLKVNPEVVKDKAKYFYSNIAEGHVSDIAKIVSDCGNFEPRVLFRIFMKQLYECQHYLLNSPGGAECSAKIISELKKTYNNVTVFNQNPRSALEELTRSVMQINYLNNGILRNGLK